MNLVIIIVLSLLWIISQVGVTTTIALDFEGGYFQGLLNKKEIGRIKADTNVLESIEVSFDNSYLPKPVVFSPKIIAVRYFDSNGKAIFTTTANRSAVSPTLKSNKVEIQVLNSINTEVKINESANNYYYFSYQAFRERESQVGVVNNGIVINKVGVWRGFSFSISDSLRLIAYILLYPLPYVYLSIFGYLILKKVVPNQSRHLDLIKDKLRLFRELPKIGIALTFCFMFAYLLWSNVTFIGKIPETPDAVGYLWQAKYLAAGRLWLPPPSDFFKEHFIINNRWVVVYPLGHPLMLAVGVLLKNPWVIPSLVGTLFLILLYKFVSENFGHVIGYSTLLIAFFSPLFQMHAVTFMSHNTAAFYLMVFIFCLFKLIDKQRNRLLCLLGGVSFALLYNTRSLTAVALAPVIVLLVTISWFKQKIQLSNLFLMSLSAIATMVFFFFLNYQIYGHPIKTLYFYDNKGDFIGGASGHTWAKGFNDTLNYLLVLRVLIFAGLPNLFLYLLLLALFTKSRGFIVLFSFLSILALAIGWMTFGNVWGIYLGPRFWYEMTPPLFILIGASLHLICTKIRVVGHVVVMTIVGLIIVNSINGWILGNKKPYEVRYFTPSSIRQLKGFNFVDARLIKEANRQNLHNALIFVKDCGNWWCYGSVLNENSIGFNGDIVWAKDLGSRNIELRKQYKGRKIYFADYDENRIYGMTSDD